MERAKKALIIIKKILILVAEVTLDLGIMAVIAFFVVFIYAYKHSPSAEMLVHRKIPETTVIYDKTGEHILYKIHGEENRQIVSHEQISDYIRKATVMIEDERFYSHIGIDFKGIARALYINLKSSNKAQGASTITQQLVRNAFFDREKTIVRKFKEIVMAIKVERYYSKEEILDFYLNEVPYGSNTYGVQTASKLFFGKDAKDITLGEAALLASLPKATYYYSPYGTHVDKLKSRQETILNMLLKNGICSKQEIEEAKKANVVKKIKPIHREMDPPHFVFYVIEELKKKYTKEELNAGGFHVYTTLDYGMQKRAEEIVREYAKNLPAFGASNASLVAIDPKTGGVLAMVGSINYYDTKIDGNVNVSIMPRQPGSSFKPIVYAAAFEKGYQPETLLYDVETNFGKDGSGKEYIPKNFDYSNHGIVSMRKAVAGSLNIPAVKTMYLVGKDNVIDFAEKLGITTLKNRNRFGLSLVLGSGEVKLLEEVGAFAVFANDGVRNPITGISRITGPNGEERNFSKEKIGRVISEDVARKINSVLSDNEARSYVFGRYNPLFIPNQKVAAKTGTTQNFRDALTLGYTPSLAVGVWVGNNDGKLMKPGSLGSKVASPLWNKFMSEELKDKEMEEFPDYVKVKSDKLMITGNNPMKSGDKIYYNLHSGKRISERKAMNKDPEDVRIAYKNKPHTLLFYVNKDNPLDESLEPDYEDKMLWRWEKAIGNEDFDSKSEFESE